MSIICIFHVLIVIEFETYFLLFNSSGKPAEQSSYYNPLSHLVGFGYDGDLTSYFHCGGGEPGAWWRVDLESFYCIQSVYIVNTAYVPCK